MNSLPTRPHVIPIHDRFPHRVARLCECDPKEEEGVLIHNLIEPSQAPEQWGVYEQEQLETWEDGFRED